LTLTDSPPWPGRRLIYVADAPMRGPDVAMWKARLKTLGAQGMDDTALFGTGADAATRAFQQTHGLTVDGVVGPLTWQAAWA
jgi:peptidoglycan hydrolase-like protein with peptidoglycan-binding domain